MDAWQKAGLRADRIVFDPGIGFGKNPLQSLELMRGIERFSGSGLRLLVGHSRKSFMNRFAGAVNDLLPFCGQRIVADGLMINDPLMPLFALQFKKPVDGDWKRANFFLRDWAERHGVAPDSDTANAWYRHDPRVKEVIEADGVFGIHGLKPAE